MSVAFSRTIKSLRAERTPGAVVAISASCFVLMLWLAWLVLGRVSVYAVSTAARLEAGSASHPVQALYAGRIATNNLVLGRQVKRGDVLIELDTTTQHLQLVEEQTRRSSLEAEYLTLERVIAAEQKVLEEETAAATLGVSEAQARVQEAEAAAAYANLDAEKKTRLHAEGLLSQIDLARTSADAKKQNAVVESLRSAAKRQEAELLARATERESRIEALRREANRLAGERSKLGATLNRLASEVELRRIVAPVDGRIGEVATLRAGDVVPSGERLGAIIPDEQLKVVAQFAPATALGRVRSGQLARLRFEGFPWTQYGTLTARVSNVANEVRDGQVRVELDPSHGFRIPLQHGLPGSTEIEVERISPASLLLRTAGQMVAPRKPDAATATSAENPAVQGTAR